MTQAPHCEVSQPTWVPVSRRFSRRNCTSKVRASTSPVTGLPFTVMDTAGMSSSQFRGQKALFLPQPYRASALQIRNHVDSGQNGLGTRISLNPDCSPGQGIRRRIAARACRDATPYENLTEPSARSRLDFVTRQDGGDFPCVSKSWRASRRWRWRRRACWRFRQQTRAVGIMAGTAVAAQSQVSLPTPSWAASRRKGHMAITTGQATPTNPTTPMNRGRATWRVATCGTVCRGSNPTTRHPGPFLVTTGFGIPALEPAQARITADEISRPRKSGGFFASSRRTHRSGEILKKIVGNLLGGAVDQALAELGEFAANLGLHVIGQQRAAVLFGQRHRGAAFGETGNAAIALARYLVAVGRVEIGEMNLAFETRLHRADLGDGDRLQFGV